MPATGKTPIQFYRSTTSGNVPSAANLSPGELALNIADNDMTMYFENASGVVKRFFNNPAALKYPTADGTSGQVISTNASGVLSFADAGSSAITDNTRQAVTSSATTTIDLASGQVIDLTMAASITSLSFTNVPASGTPILVQIVIKNASNGTAYTIAWPSSVYWSGQYTGTTITNVQTAPTLATGANGVTTIALLTTDGGTKWRGWVEGTIAGGTLREAYAWGYNGRGQLGQSNTTNRLSPVQVGALTNWANVAGGRATDDRAGFTLAVKTDGTLWSWGDNGTGQLGHNNTTSISSPVQVGALTNWSIVSAGRSAFAIKTDGTLWSWGFNGTGSLGQSNGTYLSSPKQVGALTNWSKISSSDGSVIAVKTDGTLWVWGGNAYGSLGLGNLTDRNSPNQLGADTNWSEASISALAGFAVKTTGTLWAWGRNNYGALGQGGTTSTSSPVQVGALTTWSKVATGSRNNINQNSCLAIKTDGTLWAWGGNWNGELGLNNRSSYSSPNQVTSATNWSTVSTNAGVTLALQTNSTLWSWGHGVYGGPGQGNTYSRSSPTQLGALTVWVQAASSGRENKPFSVAITQTGSSNPG